MPAKGWLIATASAALLAGVGASRSAEKPELAGYRVPLFDGATLAGWQEGACGAHVEEGAVRLEPGGRLVSADRYADFVLELEARVERDSPAPIVRYGCDSSCDRRDLACESRRLPADDAVRLSAGSWHRLRLSVSDGRAELELDGRSAGATDVSGTSVGHLTLEPGALEGEQPTALRLRALSVTELGQHALFNAVDLSGWQGAGGDPRAAWSVAAGSIVGLPIGGPWLRSVEEYGDFNLRLEYKVAPHANSGIYIRVPADGNHHGDGAGIEVQLLDDWHPDYAELVPYQYSGGLYDFAGPSARVSRPTGEWNRLEINCVGHSYRISHNGVPIVAADPTTHPDLAKRSLRGYLGIQSHGGGISLRHLRVGPPLPEPTAPPAPAPPASSGR